MTKSSLHPSHEHDRPQSSVVRAPVLPAQRDGSTCDLYAPGHLMHYTHQGTAVRSQPVAVRDTQVDGAHLTLQLENGAELRWRHHDPARLQRVLESVPSKRVAYPDFHALRVGPFWFNCAPQSESWQDCRLFPAPRSG